MISIDVVTLYIPLSNGIKKGKFDYGLKETPDLGIKWVDRLCDDYT